VIETIIGGDGDGATLTLQQRNQNTERSSSLPRITQLQTGPAATGLTCHHWSGDKPVTGDDRDRVPVPGTAPGWPADAMSGVHRPQSPTVFLHGFLWWHWDLNPEPRAGSTASAPLCFSDFSNISHCCPDWPQMAILPLSASLVKRRRQVCTTSREKELEAIVQEE
jgi:hypothetical protein